MKVFLGSSTEAVGTMREVANWLPPNTAVRWDERGTFGADKNFFDELIRLSKTVDGAIFIFAEDDITSSRGATETATRDNIWLEYGLFIGSLGRERVRRIAIGNPKCATDVAGLTLIKLPKDL